VKGSEHKLLGPVVDWHDLKLTRHNATMRAIGQKENNYVNNYQGVVCVWGSPRPNTCPNG